MPTYSRQWEGYVAYKVQSGLGTAASGAGGSILPVTGGRGMMTKTPIASTEVRQDGMTLRGRHGTQATSGSYPGELQLGNYDDIFQAVMRGTWAAAVVITQATAALSSATISALASVVTFSAGSVITAGVKVGDVHMWTVGLAAGDLNRPLRVTAATALTITYAETLTTVAGPVATYTFSNKGKTLINPAAGSLTQRYFTIEEYEYDLDQSQLYSDCKWSKLDIAMQPNGMITIAPAWVGTGAVSALTGASSPSLTSPALPLATATPLAAIDATVRLSDTSDILSLTAFNLSIDLGAIATPVAAANVSPDVFDGQMKISGSLTFLRTDLTPFTDYIAETQLSLQVLAKVPGSSPTDFISFYVPNFTLGSADRSEFKRDGGPFSVQTNFPADLVGIDTRGGAYDSTMIKIQRSTST